MIRALIRWGEDTQRQWEKKLGDDKDREWNNAASQGMLRTARSHQELGRGKEGFLQEVPYLGFQTSSLQNYQRINFYCFKSPSLWQIWLPMVTEKKVLFCFFKGDRSLFGTLQGSSEQGSKGETVCHEACHEVVVSCHSYRAEWVVHCLVRAYGYFKVGRLMSLFA